MANANAEDPVFFVLLQEKPGVEPKVLGVWLSPEQAEVGRVINADRFDDGWGTAYLDGDEIKIVKIRAASSVLGQRLWFEVPVRLRWNDKPRDITWRDIIVHHKNRRGDTPTAGASVKNLQTYGDYRVEFTVEGRNLRAVHDLAVSTAMRHRAGLRSAPSEEPVKPRRLFSRRGRRPDYSPSM